MAILVTGGAGFIGSHLIEELFRQGKDVVCLDNFNDYYDPRIKRANIVRLQRLRAFPVYEADVCDQAACGAVFEKHNIESIAHLAARVGVRDSLTNPFLYEEVNCTGTIVMLDLARRHGVRKFVLGSTSSIYGGSTRIPFNEEDPVFQPISPYASSKRAAELYCYTYHHLYKLPVVCVRFFTVYGPWGRPDMAVYKFTRLVDQGRPIPVYGPGTSKRDFTYVKDIVQGVAAALSADLQYEIINLGESRVVELNYMISLIEKALGRQAKREQLPEQAADLQVTYADIGKARRLLGYQPRFPFEEGLRLFMEWYHNERPRFD